MDSERKPVNFYDLPEEKEGVERGEKVGLRPARLPNRGAPELVLTRKPSTKTSLGTKLDTIILEDAREFCRAKGITFASFLEVAIVDELAKLRGDS